MATLYAVYSLSSISPLSLCLSLTPALLGGDVELHPVSALAAAVLLSAHAALGRAAVGVGGAAAADQRHLVRTFRDGDVGRVGEDLPAVRRGRHRVGRVATVDGRGRICNNVVPF